MQPADRFRRLENAYATVFAEYAKLVLSENFDLALEAFAETRLRAERTIRPRLDETEWNRFLALFRAIEDAAFPPGRA